MISKQKIKKLWAQANGNYNSLCEWSLDDIRDGKHPEYENEKEYMRDLGYWEGRDSVLSEIITGSNPALAPRG